MRDGQHAVTMAAPSNSLRAAKYFTSERLSSCSSRHCGLPLDLGVQINTGLTVKESFHLQCYQAYPRVIPASPRAALFGPRAAPV